MYLTLPLPVQKTWMHSIFYIPWDLNKPHIKVRLYTIILLAFPNVT